VPKGADAVAVVNAPAANADSLPVKAGVASMEQDGAIERLLQRDRTPLAYEHLREDDALYKQRVWRDIDINEKMNQPFIYGGEDDNGSAKFIDILLSAIQKDPNVVAYSAIDGDRFTTPMKKSELKEQLVGPCYTERVPDKIKDPFGDKNIFKDSLICPDFNSTKITRFRLKEDWVFDKESSRMFVRIIGIAPIQVDSSAATGFVTQDRPLFWVYYPKLRSYLAKVEAYNGKNFGARPTWEEIFEGRMFSSFIVKSTIDNPNDVYLKSIPGLKENGILRLWEGENIKKQIFDYEQNLWSY
jgi:gliding motility associated protien GldN